MYRGVGLRFSYRVSTRHHLQEKVQTKEEEGMTTAERRLPSDRGTADRNLGHPLAPPAQIYRTGGGLPRSSAKLIVQPEK